MTRTSFVFVLAAIGWIFPLSAQEPAERFVEALRDNGYYDIAIDYLKDLETNGMASPEFVKVLPFERAETLIKSTEQLRNIDTWEERLIEAENLLKKYAPNADTDEAVAVAEQYRGNLLYKRAKVHLFKADSDLLTAAEKEKFLSSARGFLQQAAKIYESSRVAMKSAIENYQIDPEDPNSKIKLRKMQGTYTVYRGKLPKVTEQLADTYPAGNDQAKALLTKAAEDYLALWDDYPNYPTGLDAGLFSARCNYKLGNVDEALARLTEIFELSDNSAFRLLKRNALVLAADCWDQKEPYPYDEIIKRCKPLLDVLSRTEAREKNWLRIQLVMATALHMKAEAALANKQPGAAAEARTLNREAAKLAKTVSRVPGENQELARKLLAEWNIKFTAAEAEEAPPATFVDARGKCQDYVTEVESIVNEIGQLKLQLGAAATQTEKDSFQESIVEAEQRLAAQTEASLQMFDLALNLVDEQTVREDINKIRYFQTFCYYVTEQYYEATIIGEWLMNRYPAENWTRQSAGLVAKSYRAMLKNASEDDRDFEIRRLTNVCELIVDQWPGTNESGAAASTMTGLALNNKDFAKAEKFFAAIQDDSPVKAPLGITMGTKLWFEYGRLAKEKDPTAPAMLKRAKDYLKNGLEQLDPKDINYSAALGSLLLVQAHSALNESDLAIKRLEEESVSPLDLVKQRHPAVFQASSAEVFVRETYRVSVKTYLAAMKDSKDQQKWINKVRGVISAMQDELKGSNDPKVRQRLTNMYRFIATELLEQFDGLSSPDDKAKFAKNLAVFMESIEKDSNDSRTVLWAGSTLLRIANSLVEQSQNQIAGPLFKQAVSALNRAESIGFAGDNDADKLKIELMRQRALAQRGSGNYEAAVKQQVEILKISPSVLTVQIDAADTLQMWAQSTKRSKIYAEAMMGRDRFKNPKTRKTANLIWGWRKLLAVSKDRENLQETFIKSLYNLIEARFEYGLIEKSDKAINSAMTELKNARKRDPEMGGAEWNARFNRLEKRIAPHVK